MCTCHADIEKRLSIRAAEKFSEGTEHAVKLDGYGLAIVDNDVIEIGVMPMNVTFKTTLKNGTVKDKKIKQSMMFTYCPFCAEKYIAYEVKLS